MCFFLIVPFSALSSVSINPKYLELQFDISVECEAKLSILVKNKYRNLVGNQMLFDYLFSKIVENILISLRRGQDKNNRIKGKKILKTLIYIIPNPPNNYFFSFLTKNVQLQYLLL